PGALIVLLLCLLPGPAASVICTLSLHDALPILAGQGSAGATTLLLQTLLLPLALADGDSHLTLRGGTHVAWSPPVHYVRWVLLPDRKSTRLNSSHVKISYAVFCLKKKRLRHYLH